MSILKRKKKIISSHPIRRDMKISGGGCIVVMIIALAFIGFIAYRTYLESKLDGDCMARGGKMVQTSIRGLFKT
jgi:hypothetical protein